MEGVRLEDVRRALEARDPNLAALVASLAQSDVMREQDGPPEEGALSYADFVYELRSWRFSRMSEEEQRHYRQQQLALLTEQERAPERLWLHEIIWHLWEMEDAYGRAQLLEVIATCPLRWGPWKGLKRLFKLAEERQDVELLGALAARIDSDRSRSAYTGEISYGTTTYMVRRAWRYLRRTGERFPSRYADVAVEFLRFYPEETNWGRTWIANHVFYHQTKQYSQLSFHLWRRPKNMLEKRAFEAAWQRTPRPLFTLLERANSEHVRGFAIEALKSDFRTVLREVEPSWVARLTQVDSRSAHDFVVWLLGNVPKFEASSFREMGLHEAVLRLLESPSDEARTYAAEYARTHARDMNVEQLLRLVNNSNEKVRKLAVDLLRDKDPRKEVGLDAWGSLLGTSYGHKLATEMLRKHFGAGELTAAWFRERLRSEDWEVRNFARESLVKVHSYKTLGVGYFIALIDDEEIEESVSRWALEQIMEHYAIEEVDEEFWRRALLHPATSSMMRGWILSDKLKARSFGVDFWKALAYHPSFAQDAWIQKLKSEGPSWARNLEFNEGVAQLARQLLGDVRQFGPDEVGFEWLMQLVKRLESHYHNFAESYMLKALVPADFAPTDESEESSAASSASSGGGSIDLNKASFMFTGKLATMTRSEAEEKVTTANGINANSVTKTLDYLVVGDDGSPLFGNGKKGSKIVKAEKLQSEGFPIKVVSETAFLQMLSGGIREISEDATEQGSEALWEMAVSDGPADEPLRRFAMTYIRHHHELLGPSLTERQVDPGAEIPREFFSWERVSPVLKDGRAALRKFARDIAMWELARWAPTLHQIVEFTELPYPDVAELFERALLAPESKETQYYRLGREQVSVDGVYRLCESLDRQTRKLGMALIDRYPDLAQPAALFRLTESPDRQLRAFAIRTIWSLYREQGVTRGWKPTALEVRFPTQKTKKGLQDYEAGPGVSERPEQWPAAQDELGELLRRALYGIPPAKLPPAERGAAAEEAQGSGNTPAERRLQPISAREAKRALIEVMRDLAVEDEPFAARVAPLLAEFMQSRGKSERSACLVALAQIDAAHPNLGVMPESVTVIAAS